MSHALAGGGSKGDPLGDMLETLADYLEPDRAAVALYNRANDSFRFPVTHGTVRREGDKIELSESILREVVEKGLSVLTSDAMTDQRFIAAESIQFKSIRSVMVAPIEHRGVVLGAVYLDTTKTTGLFTEDDLELVGAVGRMVGLILYKQRAEEQMASMQKFHSLGVLASGIVHQIKTPLTIIQASAELLLMRKADKAMLKEKLEKIVEATKRVSGTISNLLHFARRPDEVNETFSVEDAINAALDLVATEIKRANVKVEIDVPPNTLIQGNRNAIEQIFLNLSHNAAQALKGYRDDPQITIRAMPTEGDRRVAIYFSDNGPGIPVDVANQIFDPFFTTKESGEGTGLGLALAMDIVHKHAGSLRLDPHSTEGACFELVLPKKRPKKRSTDPGLSPRPGMSGSPASAAKGAPPPAADRPRRKAPALRAFSGSPAREGQGSGEPFIQATPRSCWRN